MNRILNRANQRIGFGSAAALLIGASALTQILGFLRIKLINANFSPFGPESTDAFFAAFKIPDFFYFTLAAGALGVAFMPFLADRIAKGDRKAVWEISNSLLNFMAVLMLVVALVILLFADPLIRYIVAPDLTPEQHYNAATIMRLAAFSPLLFTLSAIFVSVQQSFGRFFFFAIAPLFYNLSIIASIFIFKDNIGLIGLGIGALVGGLLQLFVAALGFIGLPYRYRLKINWRNQDFRGALKQLPPRSLDQGVDSLNSIVETNFARRLGEGKITFYENAYVLHTAPTYLIGTTISTAAFPRLNDRLAQGRSDLFRRDFLQVLRTIIWVTAPIVIVAWFGRGYLARLIFSREAAEIASVFGFFAVAIFFRTVYTIMSRWFYSQKDTKTPLIVSLIVIALNIFLAYKLSKHYNVEGLAMAQSIVAAVEVAILSVIMIVRDPKLLDRDFWAGILKIVSVSGFTVLITFTMLQIYPLTLSDKGFITLGSKFGGIVLVAIGTYVSLSIVFGLRESKPVIEKIKKIVLAPIKIQ